MDPQTGMSKRKVSDCRKMPSDSHCTLVIEGEEQEVLDTAVQHAITKHGHQDTPELREQIRGMLTDVA